MSRVSFSTTLIGLLLSLNAYNMPAYSAPSPQPISVCVEDRFWPIGSFYFDGQTLGTHVEIARHAFAALSLPITIVKMPWKRCLVGVETGDIDAVLSASYLDKRHSVFHYPSGATSSLPHPQSLELIEFVLVTRMDYPVGAVLAGGPPPSPVGVPLGYMSADIYSKVGAKVTQLMNHKDLFDLLKRGRVNSLILSRPLFEFFISQPAYSGQFKQTSMPNSTGPLYLAFSKKSTLPEATMQAIWQAITAVRLNTDLMHTLTETAHAQATKCLEMPDLCK